MRMFVHFIEPLCMKFHLTEVFIVGTENDILLCPVNHVTIKNIFQTVRFLQRSP